MTFRIDTMDSSGPDALQIFTDGSFDARLGTGGWAFVAMKGEKTIRAAYGDDRGLSNNTFELLAVVRAVEWLEVSMVTEAVALWTDSVHVRDGCVRWRAIWRNNRWKRVDPNPGARRRKIPDVRFWQELDLLLTRNPNVSVAWCKAHSGILGNEQADALARKVYDLALDPGQSRP